MIKFGLKGGKMEKSYKEKQRTRGEAGRVIRIFNYYLRKTEKKVSFQKE